MTVGALEGVEAFAVWTTLDVLGVEVAVLALERHVAGRVAVQAARVHEDGIGCEKSGAGGRGVSVQSWGRASGG